MSYLDDIKNIWISVKESLRDSLAQTVIDLWFGELEIVSFENNCLSFSTNSEFKYKIITEKYIDMLKERFKDFLGFDININIVLVKPDDDLSDIYSQMLDQMPGQEENSEKVKAERPVRGIVPPNYNFEYTFDNFIVGNSNKFAHAACTAVADNPATNYNPLFIYGPSGLGKTHLMSAVVNEIKKKKDDLSVVYIKGEDFTNELIESLSKQQMNKFRDKYRTCDILLIDDIQFIAGKNSTQEEFFHTFNSLYEDHKQIILSSDRPPKDIQLLEERLKTRFEWGLIADIEPPDLELRIAIIKKKAEQVSLDIPNEVLTFLAENLRSNIRQIEGAIKKLSALSFLSGKSISMELAKSCIEELLGGAEPLSVTIEKIYTAVQKKYGIRKEDILGQKRNKEIAEARHICVYLIREITEISYPQIGKIFNRDHATIISSYDKVSKRLADPMFNVEIKSIISEITGR